LGLTCETSLFHHSLQAMSLGFGLRIAVSVIAIIGATSTGVRAVTPNTTPVNWGMRQSSDTSQHLPGKKKPAFLNCGF
jgi:hypothetical protein